MNIRLIIFINCLLIGSLQQSSITGTWRGTSICQVRNSPCHDEQAVYHVSKISSTIYSFKMNKMVDGREEEMGPGVLQYILNPADSTLTYKDTLRHAVWEFRVYGDSMQGTAVFKNQLYRVVKLRNE